VKKLKQRKSEGTIEGLSPLYSRIYSGRGIRKKEQVDHLLKALAPPDSLLGLQDAVVLLAKTIKDQQAITIIGDFDADGATSCVLMVLGLRAMGAGTVNYLVPNRFEFGYGLTPEIVEVAREQKPELIITVDNGISSVDGVNYARQCGINVLITDHHLPSDEIPNANAIVNPNQKGCEFPSKNLAGVGVAFYLLSALRKNLRESDWFEKIPEPKLVEYLDLVALGTIADVVPMDYNNRVLVQEGLRRMRAGKTRPGIRALLDLAGKRLSSLTSTDLAFGVAPRLNAAGRLDDISLGIECLLTTEESRAHLLAGQMDQLNKERREIEDEMKQQALLSLGDIEPKNNTAVGICLFDESWHQGVVGIVASRIKDKYHRPVIAFAPVSETEMKGSARSISGLHIRDALDAIASRNPGLIQKFGGHAMAAGLSLDPSNYSKFKAEFNDEAARWLSQEDLEDVIVSDGSFDDYSVTAVRHLLQACPWGQGFPEPLFDDEFEVVEQRIIGGKHLKLKLRRLESDQVLDAIAFNQNQLFERRHRRIVYRLDVNEFRGRETVQLIVENV
jgi:single-stranded-DNA-specific exonuclease